MTLLLALMLTLLPQQAPTLTDVERLTLENLNLQTQLAEVLRLNAACQAELGPVRAQVHQSGLEQARAQFIADLEKAHPGYTLDVKTGQLVKKGA